MNEEDFCLALRELFVGVRDFFESIDEDFVVFGAGVELAVVVFRWQGEAIDAEMSVHVKVVIQEMDVWDGIN